MSIQIKEYVGFFDEDNKKNKKQKSNTKGDSKATKSTPKNKNKK